MSGCATYKVYVVAVVTLNKAACFANRKRYPKQLFYFDKRMSWRVTKPADLTINRYLPFTSTWDTKAHEIKFP